MAAELDVDLGARQAVAAEEGEEVVLEVAAGAATRHAARGSAYLASSACRCARRTSCGAHAARKSSSVRATEVTGDAVAQGDVAGRGVLCSWISQAGTRPPSTAAASEWTEPDGLGTAAAPRHRCGWGRRRRLGAVLGPQQAAMSRPRRRGCDGCTLAGTCGDRHGSRPRPSTDSSMLRAVTTPCCRAAIRRSTASGVAPLLGIVRIKAPRRSALPPGAGRFCASCCEPRRGESRTVEALKPRAGEGDVRRARGNRAAASRCQVPCAGPAVRRDAAGIGRAPRERRDRAASASRMRSDGRRNGRQLAHRQDARCPAAKSRTSSPVLPRASSADVASDPGRRGGSAGSRATGRSRSLASSDARRRAARRAAVLPRPLDAHNGPADQIEERFEPQRQLRRREVGEAPPRRGIRPCLRNSFCLHPWSAALGTAARTHGLRSWPVGRTRGRP